MVPQPDGTIRERPPPDTLPGGRVTALDVYGSLLYAGARTLQVRLPDPTGSDTPAVVLRLRGRTSLGATFFVVLEDYATRLENAGGRLYLSGVDPLVLERMTRSGRLDESGPIQVFDATDVVGESTLAAHRAAQAWVDQAIHEQERPSGPAPP
jgi:SulP family sulfate permease